MYTQIKSTKCQTRYAKIRRLSLIRSPQYPQVRYIKQDLRFGLIKLTSNRSVCVVPVLVLTEGHEDVYPNCLLASGQGNFTAYATTRTGRYNAPSNIVSNP